jgi:VanZ family protein
MPSPLERLSRIVTAHPLAWRVLLLVTMLVVGYLALTPHPPPAADLGWDKLNHFSAFGTLTLLGRLGYPASRRGLVGVMLAMFAFGGGIELVQSQVPGRDAEWADLLADSIGIAGGAVLATGVLWMARHPARSRN